MTGKADFTQDEWKLVLEAPPSAGLIGLTAQKGGTFRETIAIAKAYTEARQEHGARRIKRGERNYDAERPDSGGDHIKSVRRHVERSAGGGGRRRRPAHS